MRLALLSIAALLCALLGYWSGDKLKSRSDALSMLIEDLQKIDSAILYNASPLDKAMRIDGNLAGFWAILADHIAAGSSPETGFIIARENLAGCCLTSADMDVLEKCISCLGKSRRASQHKTLEIYISQLTELQSSAQTEWRKGGGFRVKLGVLCGFAIMILLI